jgi:ubiquinone/menaquinone biosynthesis C-methylase UbiE
MNNLNHDTFQKQYISLRETEGRVYTDEEVKHLPRVALSHPLKKEWDSRQESGSRLVRYFSKKQRHLTILEVGCGNGWLSNQLSKIPGATVTGLDINEWELNQAKRVFPQIRFLRGEIETLPGLDHYDCIVFAASLQYFPSIQEIVETCFLHLKQDGEIHILDTFFYSEKEVALARSSSAAYFNRQGFSQLSNYYFHHTTADLEKFTYKVMYDPSRLYNRLFWNNPFPWICIKNKW